MEKKESSFFDLIKHLGLAIIVLIVLVYGFFNVYLPISTNQGETISVPDLQGMMHYDVAEFLDKRNLRYEIEADSGYSAKYPPLAVLKQFPLANDKVKENRKIYLTLNTKKPPVIKLPSLYGLSIKNAILEFNSLGFLLGTTTYKPASHLNTIMSMSIVGKKYQGGELVAKGSKIDFILADGLGNRHLESPNLEGLDLEEAKTVIFGSGLKFRNAVYKEEDDIMVEAVNSEGEEYLKEVPMAKGKVFKQKPRAGKQIRIGTEVDIWLVEIDSVSSDSAPKLD
jgi:beta-lactam-binding protein with PASTA domain